MVAHRLIPKLRIAIGAAIFCAALLVLSTAQAEEAVHITSAGFTPDRLGVPTNVFGSPTLAFTDLPVPSLAPTALAPAD
jgi:hypothetical protein